MKLLAFVFLVTLACWTSPALAGEETPVGARIFLSWNAPYGMPGAANNLNLAPGDTTREDQLYVTCDLGVEAADLIATNTVLLVRAVTGDTLGPYWHFGPPTGDPPHVRATFQTDSAATFLVPWKTGAIGMGGVRYFGASENGKLVMIGAVGTAGAGTLRPGARYVLGRVLFRHPPVGLGGTSRPVCVELVKVKLNLKGNRDLLVETGDRFASWNSPGCEVCKPYRGPSAPKPWQPKSPKSPN